LADCLRSLDEHSFMVVVAVCWLRALRESGQYFGTGELGVSMAYEELLEFARGRPPWQQDALRRLALSGELTDDDLAQLGLEIERAAGFRAVNAPDPVPLAEEHLSHAASNDPKTELASLGPVRHVDRLVPDQPPLRFAINGITIVYGANASGKSGYCRIARQLCRSLAPVSLRSNVYDDDAPVPPEVAVAFRVGGDDQPKEERVWFGNDEPPLELARISVFDAATARVYVDRERRIEFLPYELDLLNKLGLACRTLDVRFRERLGTLIVAISHRLPEGFREGTAVHTMLGCLVPGTQISELPSEHDLRLLGTWTAEKQIELDGVAEQLKRDPRDLIRPRADARQALELVKEDIQAVEQVLTDVSVATLRQSKQEADATRQAAEATARNLFSEQPIPDLGSDAWRRMLAYAKEFAAVVLPDAPPPQFANGGICVFCQQDLDDDASRRLSAFDDYISGRATEESDAAAQVLARHRERIMAFRMRSRREVETLLSGYAALSDSGRDGVATIGEFVESALDRLESVQVAVRENRYGNLDGLAPLADSPVRLIEEEVGRIGAEIAELENSKCDPEAFARLETHHAELADQKRLSERLEAILDRRIRLEESQRIGECLRQCPSGPITRHITRRRREILTPALRAALHGELDRLRLTHLPLDLVDHGDGAESIVEIALDARQRFGNNSDVLSEGEQRALALACFLAELHEIGTDHGIIVDDPVSSLDHVRMQAVAERLAQEAARGRQVIVFTHNIVFHHMLLSEAQRASVGCHREWMSSAGNDQFGLIDDSHQPWQMKGVRERIDEIGRDHALLSDCGYDPAHQSFRLAIIGLYTKMRETWERIVEEVLFNNTVQRFRREVMTQRLEDVCFDPDADYPAIFEGMKRCSHYSGHDPAPDLPPELPDTREVARDVDQLITFFVMAYERRRQLKRRPRHDAVVEPILL